MTPPMAPAVLPTASTSTATGRTPVGPYAPYFSTFTKPVASSAVGVPSATAVYFTFQR
jgi:hypothetical protein